MPLYDDDDPIDDDGDNDWVESSNCDHCSCWEEGGDCCDCGEENEDHATDDDSPTQVGAPILVDDDDGSDELKD